MTSHSHFPTLHRLLNARALARVGLALAMVTALLGGLVPAPARAAVSITENFRNAAAAGWVLSGNAVLTSGAPDPAGDGWLRLTAPAGNEAGSAIYNTAFSSSDGVQVTFTYAAYGGSGADGFTFYLIDGSTGSPTVGAPGGSLGYSWRQVAPVGDGVTNGYVGIGFDEWGNFANTFDIVADPYGTGGFGPGTTPGVTVRGSGSLAVAPGFRYLTRASASIETGSRAGAKRVRITIAPSATNLIVEMDSGAGYVTLISGFNLSTAAGQVALPATFKMGFSASTGGSTNYHEIRDLTVGGAQPTTTTVTSAPDPSGPGQSVTFTATVTAGTTGTVTFLEGGTVLGTGTLDGSSQATFSTSALAIGVHTITARYEGDGTYGSSSGTDTHEVVNNPTTTTVTSSVNPSVWGQGVTFTATVTDGGGGTPTGTVTFKDGGVNIGGCVDVALNGAGVGTCGPLTNLAVGNHPITAEYTHAGAFLDSTGTLTGDPQVVNKANTTTTIPTDTPDPSVFGQNYTVNFTVVANAPGVGTPTGNVTVSDGTNNCTATVAAGTCNLPSTSVGAKTLTATYAGDGNFNGSAGTTAHTVNKADTTTTIPVDVPDPSLFDQTYAVNFTVVADAPGAGTPTGNVTVSDGTNTCTATVAAGTCNLPSTIVGAKTLTATYAGDANFNGSAGTTAHTVICNATFSGSTTVSNGNPYYLSCFYGQVYVDKGEGRATGGNNYLGSVTITVTGVTVCAQVPEGFTAASPACVTDSNGGRKDFGIRPITQSSSQTTTGGQSVGSAGGTFACAPWFLIVNAGTVPDGSTLICGPFDPNAVPPAPSGLTRLRVPENANLSDKNGKALTSFNPALQMCYNYTDAELATAGGDPNNFVVINTAVGGTSWTELPTTVDAANRRVCGSTTQLTSTLFDLSARTPTALPTTGGDLTPWIGALLWSALIIVGAAVAFVVRRRVAR